MEAKNKKTKQIDSNIKKTFSKSDKETVFHGETFCFIATFIIVVIIAGNIRVALIYKRYTMRKEILLKSKNSELKLSICTNIYKYIRALKKKSLIPNIKGRSIYIKPDIDLDHLIFGPLRLVSNPSNCMIGNDIGEMKLFKMISIFILYFIISLGIFYFIALRGVLNLSDFIFAENIIMILVPSIIAWYIRLRHIYDIKWKYIVTQYNKIMMIKNSTRCGSFQNNYCLMVNLCTDLLTHGLWNEEDLRFLIVKEGFIKTIEKEINSDAKRKRENKKICELIKVFNKKYSTVDFYLYEDLRELFRSINLLLEEKHRYPILKSS